MPRLCGDVMRRINPRPDRAPMPFRYALCNELLDDRPFADQCATIAACGYTGVEIAPFTLAPRVTELSAHERAELRRTAEDAGLEVVGLHWLLAKTEGLHLTTPDDAVRERTADYLAALADCCADLGGRVLVFGSPPQRNLTDGTTDAEALDRAAAVFRAAAPTFEDRGVVLCFEPLAPAETNFVTTCGQAAELIERVGSPSFRLHQDVKAMLGGESAPPAEVIREFAGLTEHFHANDANLLGPGMGDTDFAPIFAALDDTGYDGWVSVEVFDYEPGREEIARRSIEHMRAVERRVTG